MVMDWPYGDQTLLWPGFPIRISRDLSSFAAPPSVSPLYASFIGTLPQGIHQTPFVAYKLLIQKPMLLKERFLNWLFADRRLLKVLKPQRPTPNAQPALTLRFQCISLAPSSDYVQPSGHTIPCLVTTLFSFQASQTKTTPNLRRRHSRLQGL